VLLDEDGDMYVIDAEIAKATLKKLEGGFFCI